MDPRAGKLTLGEENRSGDALLLSVQNPIRVPSRSSMAENIFLARSKAACFWPNG